MGEKMKIRKFSRILAGIVICVFAFSTVSFAEQEGQSSVEGSVSSEVSVPAETETSEMEKTDTPVDIKGESSAEKSGEATTEVPSQEESESPTESSSGESESSAEGADSELSGKAPGPMAGTGETDLLSDVQEPEEMFLLVCERKFLLGEPEEGAVPSEVQEVEVLLDGKTVRGWKEINGRTKNILLFYGRFEDSNTPVMNFYSYDRQEQTLQRYYEISDDPEVPDEEDGEEGTIEITNPVIEKEQETPAEAVEKPDIKDQKPEVVFGKEDENGKVAISFRPEEDAKTVKLILEKDEDSQEWRVEKTKSYSGVFGRILPYLIAAFVELLIFVGTLFLVKKLSN